MSEARRLPSVELLLQTRLAAELVGEYGRTLTLQAIRATLAELRREAVGTDATVPHRSEILILVQQKLEKWVQPTLIPVINASGVVLHTNLGRAPISQEALKAVASLAGGYCSLEYDLEEGARGSRLAHTEDMLKLLTGAEAAIVVNNNAAAVLLALSALASRQRVIISRTQLVEIGGGFRIPDVMAQSGAELFEVGSTNRVHLVDYETALNEPAALVVRAHPSNFRVIGFASDVRLEEIVRVAHARNVPVMDDLGSGTFIDTARFGLTHEPTIQESIAAGADLVCFSGDKLLGGPQAGIIVGRKDLIDKIKVHPLARAVRADKLCLAALSATLLHYLKDEADRKIPIWQMIGRTEEQIRARAQHWMDVLGLGRVVQGRSTIGGGSLPEETLPTYLLVLKVPQPNRVLARLRMANPPIIARIEEDMVVLDPRTVTSEQEGALLVGLQNALKGTKEL